MENKTLGETIRDFRKQKGLSVPKLAEQIAVSQSYIYDLEHGRRTPSVSMLQRFANFFGVTTDKLIGRDTSVPSEGTKNAPTEVSEGNKQHIKIVNDLMRVPVVSREMTACCGSGIGALDITSDSGEDPVWISRSELRAYDDMRPPFAIYADGDCLESDGIKSDDKVIINPAEEPQNGSIVLVSIYGMLSLKRYYRLPNNTVVLRSDTGEQRLTPEKQEDANFSVLGVLVGSFRGRPRLRSF